MENIQSTEDNFISKLSKGIAPIPDSETSLIPTSYIKSVKWNLLKEDLALPAAVLDIANVDHNLNWMDSFLKNSFDSKILLAPHGKTSMMPALFHKILERPTTWGITLATAVQVRAAHAHGTSRVLMANQLVGLQNMEIISEIKSKDEGFDFSCLVDSPDSVNLLGKFFSSKGQTIDVLLEYGMEGGRTGIRTEAVEAKTFEAIETWSGTVKLKGVEFFEGITDSEPLIRSFIDWVLSRTKVLYEKGVFGSESFILTGAGTAWFYLVADLFSKFSQDNPEMPLQLLIRPGCYIIFDIGRYNETALKVQSIYGIPEKLLQTLTIWAYVQSIPEPNLAVIAFGKRDGAMDCGYPRPFMHYRRKQNDTNNKDSTPQPSDVSEKGWKVTRMMDQHTFLEFDENDDILVGDIIVFHIAHPCTTIDKWRHIFVVDSSLDSPYEIVDVFPTFF